MTIEKIEVSEETFNNMAACCNELKNILHTITNGKDGLNCDINPYCNKTIKQALKTLAKYRGFDDYLNAAD